MKVKLIGKSRVVSLNLPQKIYGNYWIMSEEKENLINIEAQEGKWIIKSNTDIKIIENGEVIESAELIENHFYYFKDIVSEEKYRVFVGETYDSTKLLLDFTNTGNISFMIGNSSLGEEGEANYISYENENIHYNQLQITRQNNRYLLHNLDKSTNVYVNNYLAHDTVLNNGDVVFIEGLTFSFIGNTLMLGTVDNKVKYITSMFSPHNTYKLDYKEAAESSDINIELYSKEDYFVRPPRFNQVIEEMNINVDKPPAKQKTEEIPVFLTLGPMIVMGMSSSITGATALIKLMTGESTFKESFSSILTAFCMLMAMLFFPLATKAYRRRNEEKKETIRQEKYHEYLKELDKKIKDETTRQKRILIENNIALKDVGDIILYKKRNLWERKIIHNDFLELRLGIGNTKPKININYEEDHFTIEEDNLEKELKEIVSTNNILESVPVTLNFRQKYISALIGRYPILFRYIKGLLLQMLAYHSYDELKIVVLTNIQNKNEWEILKNCPYSWDNDKLIRYFATSNDEMTRISAELESIWQERNNNDKDDVKFTVHYMIISDDASSTSKVGIVNQILKSKKANGFSLLFLTDKLNSLPSECSSFISIDTNVGGIFENDLTNNKQEFIPDFPDFLINNYVYASSNIPIETSDKAFELPSVYTFLEMYNAGNVEQLNAFNRWQNNDPTTSLAAPVGISENGEDFKLDLHEKVHGPHGLIAGMTGSGKSEFIITYILSMAVNYNPNEVQFVLIDYKGGGLAGAFENKETGVKLPHLAGTITNLDISEINRSLASLQSELKRRQKMFNEARDACNESTIDIYKYQKLYREGKVKEPIAHLLIISDEFAELKSQQPDFMDELISTARIGRSLGVHLILATQKPSGVVDDQIWSNSKFRVCLKVQDKSDSQDMIKSPDAAFIKETGRFYLQVGYNELFAKGQSAWCGAPYYESEKRKKIVDNSINFVDNIGSRIKNIDNDKNAQRGVHKGEEITNILKYLVLLGNEENIKVRQLWLNAIPAKIYVDALKEKYQYQKVDFNINPVIGEYDAPKEQRQGILTLPLSREGNLLIYGSVGSGKENLITTMIYSIITTYTPEEVNLYILDFGSESLGMFRNSNHIGGIINSNDEDKLVTLFRLLFSKIEERKKLFANYNGNYESYIKNSGKTLPIIITIINGYESFDELYSNVSDDLVLLTREGQKYGLLFVLTISATNNIRMKVSQNFNQKLVLQMNDDFDYRQILGRSEVLPSKIFGRGLAKVDMIYEFQSAHITPDDDIVSFVNEKIKEVNGKSPIKAETIPELPEVVTLEHIQDAFTDLNSVPIGITKESLSVVTVELKNQISMLITAQTLSGTTNFIVGLINELSTLKNAAVYVIDAEKLIKQSFNNVKYYNSNFEKVLESFQNIVNQFNEIYEQNEFNPESLDKYGDLVFVIIGINKLQTILNERFEELLVEPIVISKPFMKISYIIADDIDSLKKSEYDGWYKNIVNSTRGIWIGNGLAEQSLFRLSVSTRAISGNLPNNFGYYIVSGNPILFKHIEVESVENSEDKK